MATDFFSAVLERTIKTWRTYTVVLSGLGLTFIVDALNGFAFFHKQTAIELAGFKVVREALSLTYGILFAVFVGAVFLESCLLERRCPVGAAQSDEAEKLLDGWLISPFSEMPLLRISFWILFLAGFGTLASFSVVHIALWWPPDPARMSRSVYRMIGILDGVLLGISVGFGVSTYRNLREVRSRLRSRRVEK
jgi:hypothetical protein